MEKKKIDLESVEIGMKRFFELFNLVLEASGYDLDRFVEGNIVSMGDSSIEKYNNEFQEMLDELTQISINSKKKELFDKLEELKEVAEINKFLEWLSEYADSSSAPYKETAFIREMDFEDFVLKVEYCFYNYVLVESGRKNIDKTVCVETELIVIRKLIFTIADLLIINNYSKEYAFSKVISIFGLKKNYIEVIWELLQKNIDKMWRIMLLNKLNRMEQKINMLNYEHN